MFGRYFASAAIGIALTTPTLSFGDDNSGSRSGNGLNRWERRDLQRDLSRTSREIYRAKHNDRMRAFPQ
jgi:hypothetical protein